MKKLFIHTFKSKIGKIKTASTEKGLALISLPGEKDTVFKQKLGKLFPDHETVRGGAINKKAEKQIGAYFEGKLKKFNLALDVQATPFQKRVLRQVQKIPYGSAKSYGDIAGAVGSPRAYRAVGSANASNNLPLVIPCHRVVAVNGLGGYGGGLNLKRKLLKLEGYL